MALAQPVRDRRRIGEILVEAGAIEQHDLDCLLETQTANGGRIGELALQAGLLTETQLRDALADQLHLPTVPDDALRMPVQLAARLNRAALERRELLPLGPDADGRVVVAMADPTDVQAADDVALMLGGAITRAVARRGALLDAIAGLGRTPRPADGAEEPVADALDPPAARFLDDLLRKAVRAGASAVHIGVTATRSGTAWTARSACSPRRRRPSAAPS